MCGIAGFVGRGDAQTLERMTGALAHRGPDASGHWSEPERGVYLGHRRLSIVDLAGGAQPMWTADGRLGVVFNGEIYNHQELRSQLKQTGCIFQTDHSDTEVLLHGYRTWGEDFVQRLNGMWAFVIYDRMAGRLFGSRDRFGKKPFYYFHEGDTFGFASELPGLLAHPSSPRSISALSLRKYFAYCYIPAPRSIYERVWKLPGGHSFTLDLATNALRLSRWWEYVIEPDLRLLEGFAPVPPDALANPMPSVIDECHDFHGSAPGDLCDALLVTLRRAVHRRLMSDVPLGVFLSGGIDSSAVARLASEFVPEGNLNTFSIGFREPTFDESIYAKQAAEWVDARHHHQTFDLEQAIALLPEIVARLDEPLGDGSLLPTYLLSRFTRQTVTVALGGDGGDELFAGYDPFRALQKAELYRRLVPRPVHDAIRHLAARLPVSHANVSFDFKIKRTLAGLSYPPPLWNAVWMGALEPRQLGELCGDPIDQEEVYSEAIETWDRCRQPDIVDRALQFWTQLYLQDGILAKVDRASMMCSLEARSPFLDIEVVELARRIPWQLKLRGGQTKWILKRALEPILPREIVHRQKKGFGMPIGRWFREGKFELGAVPGLNHGFAERKLREHLAGKVDERLFLWCYWLLEQWSKRS